MTHGAFYEILDLRQVSILERDIETIEEIEILKTRLKHVRLGFAIIYASVQSRTLRSHVRLWDTSHPRFSRKHLIMGLGRATNPDLVDLV